MGVFLSGRSLAEDAPHPKMLEIDGLWDSNKKSEAEKALDKWMSEEKKSPYPWVEAGKLRFEEKKYKRALSSLQTALDKSPQCAEAYYWRGRSFEAMNKPMDAANEYRAAVLAQEKYVEAQEALTRVTTLLDSSNSTSN